MALPDNEKLNQKDELQILQDRISSGNMQLSPEEKQTQDASKITEQLAISRGDAPQVTPQIETPQIVTSQELLADKMQNQFGANNGNQAVNTDVSIQAERKPEYLGDYSKDVDLVKIAKNANVPLQNVFADYQRWGNDTGNPTDFLRIWTAAQKGDITKTPQEIEAEEKKLRDQERLEKFANFLNHLGAFVGAAGWGGSVQGLEAPKDLTARQQALRDKTEALRTAYNKSYFENYWKQRADETKQQNQDRLERRYDLAVRQQEWKELSDQKKFDYNMEKLKIEQDYKEGLISLKQKELAIKTLDSYTRQMNARTADYKAHNPKGYVVKQTKQTPFGTQTTTTEKTYGNGSSSDTLTETSGNDWSNYKIN